MSQAADAKTKKRPPKDSDDVGDDELSLAALLACLSVLLGIDARDADESTPLMVACANDNVAAARVLLRCGADVRVARADGDTALHIAARLKANGCVRVLLEHDASPLACNRGGETPVDIARISNPAVRRFFPLPHSCFLLILLHYRDRRSP